MRTNRRKFLQNTAAATAAAVFNPALNWAHPTEIVEAMPGFSLTFMATDWGFNGSREAFCAAAKKEGYQGIEVWWPGNEKGQLELFDALKKHELQVGFLCGGWQSDVTEHLQSFVSAVEAAAKNNFQKPLYINCHSGRDHYGENDCLRFFNATTQIHRSTSVPIYHETHRGRILFAAHITRHYLHQVPDLQLTLDISHWCNVHESLLEDQQETVTNALTRTGHIHARVGHPEGPQVNDPRAPEWEKQVNQHLSWWDEVVRQKKKAGLPLTILTEFGPADYMPALPYTRQPVADQWAINVYMMNLLRKRYLT